MATKHICDGCGKETVNKATLAVLPVYPKALDVCSDCQFEVYSFVLRGLNKDD